MIHLDTNYVVGLVGPQSPLQSQLFAWLSAGEKFAVSSIAWSEFLTGPVTSRQVGDASRILESRIIAFGVIEAARAAEIFNLTGRRRITRTDCFIAATAICARMPLATQNSKDFAAFVPLGLRLA
jgi:predicted nucleic acid-binding protein